MFDQPPERIGFPSDQQLTTVTTLPAGLWQEALRLIQDWPWRVANPIIGQWMPQLQGQHGPRPPEPEPEPEPEPPPSEVAALEGADPA